MAGTARAKAFYYLSCVDKEEKMNINDVTSINREIGLSKIFLKR